LRRKEPELFRPYKVPAYPWLPVFIAILAAIAGSLYAWSNVRVILPTAALYAAAGVWYALHARKKVLPIAPEEVAARIAEELARKQTMVQPKGAILGAEESNFTARTTAPIRMPSDPPYSKRLRATLERVTGPALGVGILSLVWMILRARGVVRGVLPEATEVALITSLWGFLFVLVSAIGLMSAS
jgi:hypothetical protein